MLKEIYHKLTTDPTYQEGILEHSDAIEAYIEKIKMILNTSRGDILAHPNFGVNLNELIFNHDVSGEKIREEILSNIIQFCPENKFFETKIEVKFHRGNHHDTALVDIYINGTKYFGILVK